MTTMNKHALIGKWEKVLKADGMTPIAENYKQYVTSALLENYAKETHGQVGGLFEGASEGSAPAVVSDNFQGGIKGYDPVLISLIRRTAPNSIAYDICGLQPMNGPTGLIFAMRPKYINVNQSNGARTTGNDAFYYEAETGHAGAGANIGNFGDIVMNGSTTTASPLGSGDYDPGTAGVQAAGFDTGTGMSTLASEYLGSSSGNYFQEMGFTLDKISVTATTRALKAEYSTELAQDLRQIHGLDAEAELANILSTEIIAETNREVVRTIYAVSKRGAQHGTQTAGTFDLTVDSNGRWNVEQFKGMLFQIEREANLIAKETRRGKGNIIICSADVASALAMAGVLDYAPALQAQSNLDVDDTGNTFAGVLNGRYRVYIDPYAPAGVDFFVVGYKGKSAYDAGVFYCPYVPLQMFKTVGSDNFQPRIGFKARYGMVANPFAGGATADNGTLKRDANVYYRKVRVTNIM